MVNRLLGFSQRQSFQSVANKTNPAAIVFMCFVNEMKIRNEVVCIVIPSESAWIFKQRTDYPPLRIAINHARC